MSIKRRGILGLLSLGVAGPAAAQLTGRSSDQLSGGGLINPDVKPQPSSIETTAFLRWEYKLVHIFDALEVTLNALGASGWELTTTGGSNTFIFKRPVSTTIHFNCLDSKSIMDSTVEIADAVHKAINNGHPIRNAISTIR